MRNDYLTIWKYIDSKKIYVYYITYIILNAHISHFPLEIMEALNFYVFASILFAVATFSTIIVRLRKRWPIRVNCWFCNEFTKIWSHEKDWWLCPSCDQYNGFQRDGGYKHDIPEQYKEVLNVKKRYVIQGNAKDTVKKSFKNGICKNCNKNEQRKLLKLSNFEPINEKYFNVEVEKLKEDLEMKYPLCKNCKNIVSKSLEKQSRWLTQYKMLFYKQRPIQVIVNNRERVEKFVRLLLTIINSIVIYYKFWLLPIGGISLQIYTFFTATRSKKKYDFILLLLWICLATLLSNNELNFIQSSSASVNAVLDVIEKYHINLMLAGTIGIVNVVLSSRRVCSKNLNVSFKKLVTPMRNGKLSNDSSFDEVYELACGKTKKNDIDVSHSRSPVNITNLLMNPVSVETPVPIKPSTYLKSPIIFEKQGNSWILSDESTLKNDTISSTNQFSNSCYDTLDNNNRLNDSMNSLSSLSLSENCSGRTSKTSKVFQTKVYGTVSPDLFHKLRTSNATNKKSILAPPKLMSVTSTSWVAGGYWQENTELPSLSRSSSQSSGFGSTGSYFGPSKEPSVNNDFDRCSVLSDSTQYGYNSFTHRQFNTNPLTSSPYSNQGPQTPQFSLSRPESQRSNFTQCSHSQHTLHNYEMTIPHSLNSSFCDHSMRNGVANQCTAPELQPRVAYSSNPTTTVITGPLWLPALLCGSLVFNMIITLYIFFALI